MRIDSLFNILSASGKDENFEAQIQLDASHEIFSGHFPGQAVVPGVGMIRMIRAVTEKITRDELKLKKALNVKFLNIVDPDKHPRLTIHGSILMENDGEYVVTAVISYQETTFLKFKGVFSIFVSGD